MLCLTKGILLRNANGNTATFTGTAISKVVVLTGIYSDIYILLLTLVQLINEMC